MHSRESPSLSQDADEQNIIVVHAFQSFIIHTTQNIVVANNNDDDEEEYDNHDSHLFLLLVDTL